MSWWGKLIGGALGFAVSGPIGAVLGAAIGHSFDKGLAGIENFAPDDLSTEDIQAAFFGATFSIMGHVAKADGIVSQDEISVAQNTMSRMQLNNEQQKAAQSLFTQGKSTSFDYKAVAEQLKQECGRRRNLLQMFIEIQIATALADGELHANEQAILMELAEILGFNRQQFEHLLAMAVAQQRFHHSNQGFETEVHASKIDEAYEVLGVNQDCSDQELKRAYRRLMSQHHPDKLVAKGLPEEMMKLATEKTQQIKEAYELVKQNRNLK
ncbi:MULTISPECIES: co-chaperone DjlA [unclassified Oleiphilus]|uniref:co-chaperone DjlA n=1 Tax=unclassified Oleiphilus TaxID=2631174 RepID=UPI0007C2C07E|nr:MULTISPECIES: co-chaperone DjlA [unclassified Oleiphilus]KZY64485.1 molecular chaperone DjlA [Oleiphilus sp. HI0066]KZY71641.1 molecular chaperone DjlA [Oleiphilus sp. HI0067]